jgi:hypothetical protein
LIIEFIECLLHVNRNNCDTINNVRNTGVTTATNNSHFFANRSLVTAPKNGDPVYCFSPHWLPTRLSGKLLLALANTVILDSNPRGTHDHILLSHDSD